MDTEEKKVTHTFAFTWAPDHNKHYKMFIDPNKQLCAHFEVIRVLGLCAYFQVYPEFHVSGNLHYHGIVRVWDIVKWYKKVLPTFKYHGFVVCKPNPNIGWEEYVRKNCSYTQAILKVLLPITQNDDYSSVREQFKDMEEKAIEEYFDPEA